MEAGQEEAGTAQEHDMLRQPATHHYLCTCTARVHEDTEGVRPNSDDLLLLLKVATKIRVRDLFLGTNKLFNDVSLYSLSRHEGNNERNDGSLSLR